MASLLSWGVGREGSADGWQRVELPAHGGALVRLEAGGGPVRIEPWRRCTRAPVGDALGLIAAVGSAGHVRHAFLPLRAAVYRNGEANPIAGIAVLDSRDCLTIHLAGLTYRLFYDGDTGAAVAPHAGAAARCPLCKAEIERGARAVRCPGCATAYHEAGARTCWSAQDACAVCGRSTELGATSRWTPVGLGRLAELEDGGPSSATGRAPGADGRRSPRGDELGPEAGAEQGNAD